MTPSDADRERLAEELGRHYVAGHVDAAELDARLGTVYGDGPDADADAAVKGLPPLPRDPAPVPSKRRGLLRRRGHGERESAQPGWRPTPERFLDPTTSRIIRVWIDPADGTRRYVAES